MNIHSIKSKMTNSEWMRVAAKKLLTFRNLLNILIIITAIISYYYSSKTLEANPTNEDTDSFAKYYLKMAQTYLVLFVLITIKIVSKKR